MESHFHASRKPPEDHEFTIEDILRDRYLQQIHPPVDVVVLRTQPVAAKAETIAVEAVSPNEGLRVKQDRSAGKAVEGQPRLAEMQMPAPESSGVCVKSADEPEAVQENLPAAAPPVIRAAAGAAEEPAAEAKAETESGTDAAKSEAEPQVIGAAAGAAEAKAETETGAADAVKSEPEPQVIEVVARAPEEPAAEAKAETKSGAADAATSEAESHVLEAVAGAPQKSESAAKTETESGAAYAAKSGSAREGIWVADDTRVETAVRSVAGSGTGLSEPVSSPTKEDADHGIKHGNGAGKLSHRGSGSRFAPTPATSRSSFKNGKKETKEPMESLFHTAPNPQVVSEAGSRTNLSPAVPPRTKENEDHGITHGNGAKALRFWDAGDGVVHTPARKVDNSRIKNEVILAQRLSREQERGLHFIIQRYRLLCNRLVEVANNLHSRVFLITSALAEEGKTLTTANLAFALSGIERKRTLLMDLDLRRYTLHSVLGIPSSKSEPSFLETEDWHACLWSLRPNLDALLPTRPADQPDELLHSTKMQNLLVAARQEYDYVLIDSAPLLLAADTHALLPIIDQALLVVRADHTPIACSQDALKILGDKAVGCILNDVKRMKYESYYHGYYGTDD